MLNGSKIPATVITGFLGAGKTTLIRHMLANAKGKRIALIINEFGDLGVDGDVLKGCGDEVCSEEDIVELNNGCICCTWLTISFRPWRNCWRARTGRTTSS
jgi:cobalamin biosynthesis protein CobW